MGTANAERRAEIVQLLSQAIDSIADAVGSGRLGFDYAVKEYVEQSENELASAFKEYVRALNIGNEIERTSSKEKGQRAKEIRRQVLLQIADRFDVPELRTFVAALLESQDKELSLIKTLHNQAEQLRRPIPRHDPTGTYTRGAHPVKEDTLSRMMRTDESCRTQQTLVALIRGINVGRAKRVTMADLRALVADLGYGDVRTLLNSGNVIFAAHGTAPGDAAALIQERLATRIGVPARVTVLTAAEIVTAVDDNPLLDIADDFSRLLVSVLMDPADRPRLEPLLEQDWRPEVLALGARVAYLWCPEGARTARLPKAIGRALGDAVTTRNWATLTKLHALAEGERL